MTINDSNLREVEEKMNEIEKMRVKKAKIGKELEKKLEKDFENSFLLFLLIILVAAIVSLVLIPKDNLITNYGSCLAFNTNDSLRNNLIECKTLSWFNCTGKCPNFNESYYIKANHTIYETELDQWCFKLANNTKQNYSYCQEITEEQRDCLNINILYCYKDFYEE